MNAYLLCYWVPVTEDETDLEIVAVIEAADEKAAEAIAKAKGYETKGIASPYFLTEKSIWR